MTALVLHGRPGKFSAGFDLSVMTGGDLPAMASLVSDGGALVRTLYGSSIPVVAACTGHALAAGALVLLGCDVRIGADVDCKIGLNEVAIGMVLPDWAFTIAVDRLEQAPPAAGGGDGAHHLGRRCRRGGVPRRGGSRSTRCSTWPSSGPPSFAALDLRAYAGTVRRLRGEVLDLMDAQIAADREAGRVPTV